MLSYDVRRGLAQVVAVREVSERQPRGSGCEGLPMLQIDRRKMRTDR